MTNSIVITTESSSDLPIELIEKYNIDVIPMHVTLDHVQYLDGVNFNIKDIFNVYDEKKIIPSTTPLSVVEYIEFFKKYTSTGASVIHISLSSTFSDTYQNACLAAKGNNNVYIIDSKTLSMGVAQLAIKAALLRDKGLSASAIVKEINGLIPKLDSSFIIASLEFLKKEGTCSDLNTFGANILQVKPCIQISDGQMEVLKKYRGKAEDAFFDYINDKLSEKDNIDLDRILIAYSGISDDKIDEYRKQLKKISKFKEIIIENVGCATASNLGKGVMGLFFFTK